MNTSLPSRVLAAAICCAILFALPAFADTIYDNGPINGSVDSWAINFGFVVSDSFTISSGTSTITGLTFGTFGFPGDVLESVQISITSSEFGGTTYFDQVVSTTQSNCHANQYGFNVCTQSAAFDGPTLADGNLLVELAGRGGQQRRPGLLGRKQRRGMPITRLPVPGFGKFCGHDSIGIVHLARHQRDRWQRS